MDDVFITDKGQEMQQTIGKHLRQYYTQKRFCNITVVLVVV